MWQSFLLVALFLKAEKTLSRWVGRRLFSRPLSPGFRRTQWIYYIIYMYRQSLNLCRSVWRWYASCIGTFWLVEAKTTPRGTSRGTNESRKKGLWLIVGDEQLPLVEFLLKQLSFFVAQIASGNQKCTLAMLRWRAACFNLCCGSRKNQPRCDAERPVAEYVCSSQVKCLSDWTHRWSLNLCFFSRCLNHQSFSSIIFRHRRYMGYGMPKVPGLLYMQWKIGPLFEEVLKLHKQNILGYFMEMSKVKFSLIGTSRFECQLLFLVIHLHPFRKAMQNRSHARGHPQCNAWRKWKKSQV